MTINKQICKLAGITEFDFKQWCKDNNKPSYKREVKADFFARVQDGRLIKDTKTGKLIKKYRKQK